MCCVCLELLLLGRLPDMVCSAVFFEVELWLELGCWARPLRQKASREKESRSSRLIRKASQLGRCGEGRRQLAERCCSGAANLMQASCARHARDRAPCPQVAAEPCAYTHDLIHKNVALELHSRLNSVAGEVSHAGGGQHLVINEE